ncbi:hypothetical protein HDV00_004973 [Rhizophlyctis rosea]|nr:hypothetical protein HDV00_004973 [Rhizophlyctis rosea]
MTDIRLSAVLWGDPEGAAVLRVKDPQNTTVTELKSLVADAFIGALSSSREANLLKLYDVSSENLALDDERLETSFADVQRVFPSARQLSPFQTVSEVFGGVSSNRLRLLVVRPFDTTQPSTSTYPTLSNPPPYQPHLYPPVSGSSSTAHDGPSGVTHLKPIPIHDGASATRSSTAATAASGSTMYGFASSSSGSDRGAGSVAYADTVRSDRRLDDHGLGMSMDVIPEKFGRGPSGVGEVAFVYGTGPRGNVGEGSRMRRGSEEVDEDREELPAQSRVEVQAGGYQHKSAAPSLSRGTTGFSKLEPEGSGRSKKRKRLYICLGIVAALLVIIAIAVGVVITLKNKSQSQGQNSNGSPTQTPSALTETGSVGSQYIESGPVTAIAVSTTGTTIFTASNSTSDHVITQWYASDGSSSAQPVGQARYFVGHNATITSIHLSADGQYMFSGDSNGGLFAWNVSTTPTSKTRDSPIANFTSLTSTIPSITYIDSLIFVKSNLYVGGRGPSSTTGILTVINLATFAHPARTFTQQAGPYFDLTKNSNDGTIYWNDGRGSLCSMATPYTNTTTTKSIIQTMSSLTSTGMNTGTYINGSYAFITSPDLLGLYDLLKGTTTTTWLNDNPLHYDGTPPPSNITDHITLATVSPDGTYVCGAVSGTNKIKQWVVGSAYPMTMFSGHSDAVTVMAVSPDGKYLFSGGNDWKINQWQISNRATFGKDQGAAKNSGAGGRFAGLERVGGAVVVGVVSFLLIL